MAKNSNKDATVEQDEPLEATTADEVLSGVDLEDARKIEQIISSNELSGGSIRLERKGPTDSTYQYVAKFKVADGFDLEFIKQVYGGGDYKAKTFRSTGAFHKPFEFSIDYRHKGKLDVDALPKPGGDKQDIPTLMNAMRQWLPQADGKADDRMMAMFKTMGDSQQAMMMFMMQSQQQQSQQMMGMFTAMATAMAGNKSTPTDITPVLIEMIKSSHNGGSSKSGSDLPTLIEAMRSLKELTGGAAATATGGDDEKETTFDKIMKYGGPVLAAILTKTPLAMPGAPAGQPQLPAPSDQPPAIDVNTNAQMPPAVGAFIGMILGAASKNADTATYANLIDDSLDPAQADILCGILQRPDWIEKLAETDRRVLNFAPWFTKLRGELLELYGATPIEQDAQNNAGEQSGSAGASLFNVAPTISIPGRGTTQPGATGGASSSAGE